MREYKHLKMAASLGYGLFDRSLDSSHVEIIRNVIRPCNR